LVNEKFAEWTHGLNARESMVSVFEHVRDIPYSLAVPLHDLTTAPEQILAIGRGSCAPKHYLLAEMYRRLDQKVVYATFPFLWNDIDIMYPPRLRRLAATVPISYHLACRVQVGCRWILVDATWDLPLKKAGFAVNEDWDGYSETECAVKPLNAPVRTAFCRPLKNKPYHNGENVALYSADGKKDHREAEDRARYYRERTSVRTPDEAERTARFNTEFSLWLESLR
jgi:hypothetical protein